MTTRIKTIAYWAATAVVALEMAVGGITDLVHGGVVLVAGPPVADIIQSLGYPVYLLTILGAWKLPCALVLLLPGLPRLKEWAYAGAVINYSGAFASYVLARNIVDFAGGQNGNCFELLVFAVISWALRPPGRRLGTIVPWKPAPSRILNSADAQARSA